MAGTTGNYSFVVSPEIEAASAPRMAAVVDMGVMDRMFTSTRLRMAGAVLAAGLALAACSGDDRNSGESTTTTSLKGTTTTEASAGKGATGIEDCPIDLSVNRADTKFATPISLFESFAKDGGLVDKATATSQLRQQVSQDARIAGAMSAVFSMRDTIHDRTPLSLETFAAAANALKVPAFAETEVTELCENFAYIEARDGKGGPETQFAVTSGKATTLTMDRSVPGQITFKFEPITVDRVVKGFVFGANFDDKTKVTPENAPFYKQFMNDVIVTEDGTIIIRNLALNGGITLVDDAPDKTPVQPEEVDGKVPEGTDVPKDKKKGGSDKEKKDCKTCGGGSGTCSNCGSSATTTPTTTAGGGSSTTSTTVAGGGSHGTTTTIAGGSGGSTTTTTVAGGGGGGSTTTTTVHNGGSTTTTTEKPKPKTCEEQGMITGPNGGCKPKGGGDV